MPLNTSSSSSDYSFEAVPVTGIDLILTDINESGLKKLSDMSGIQHLSPGSFETPAFPVEGLIYGPNKRLMVCLNCQRANRPNAQTVKVWFLVDTGSYYTFLDVKAVTALIGTDAIPSQLSVAIQDPNSKIACDISHDHFKDANVLGMGAMEKLAITIADMDFFNESWQLKKSQTNAKTIIAFCSVPTDCK